MGKKTRIEPNVQSQRRSNVLRAKDHLLTKSSLMDTAHTCYKSESRTSNVERRRKEVKKDCLPQRLPRTPRKAITERSLYGFPSKTSESSVAKNKI